MLFVYQRKSGWCFAGGGGGKVRLHSWKCLQKPSPVCYCHKCRVITFCDYVDVTGSCNTSPSTHTIVKSTPTHGAYAVNATLPHPSNCKFRPAHRLANFQKKKFEGERKLGTFGGVELLLAFPLSAPPPPIFALFLWTCVNNCSRRATPLGALRKIVSWVVLFLIHS